MQSQSISLVLPRAHYLCASRGAGAVAAFFAIIPNYLVPFGAAGEEFIEGKSLWPVEPTDDDRILDALPTTTGIVTSPTVSTALSPTHLAPDLDDDSIPDLVEDDIT